MGSKRCPDCRGTGYRIIADRGAACARCDGTGQIAGSRDIPPDNRAIVRRRSGGMCEVCHVRPATDQHHRQYRSRQGEHLVENLIDICGPGNVFGCHADAHGIQPLEGVSINSWESRPIAEIPFTDKRGSKWLLHADGTKTLVAGATVTGDAWRKP